MAIYVLVAILVILFVLLLERYIKRKRSQVNAFMRINLYDMKPKSKIKKGVLMGGYWSQAWTNGSEEAFVIWDDISRTFNKMGKRPSYLEPYTVIITRKDGSKFSYSIKPMANSNFIINKI